MQMTELAEIEETCSKLKDEVICGHVKYSKRRVLGALENVGKRIEKINEIPVTQAFENFKQATGSVVQIDDIGLLHDRSVLNRPFTDLQHAIGALRTKTTLSGFSSTLLGTPLLMRN